MNPIKVSIQNYQSIKDIDFVIKGFTCLVGVTNIGKSAIIRAITSAIENNSVVGMVRKGANHATVNISNDEWDLKWEKGEKNINRYTINGKVYDKVGAKKLDAVNELGFKSVRVGQDEINPWYASQFFPIFLLDRPGSQITDFISEVSRLNVLQDAIILTARLKKKVNDEINVKVKEITDIESKLKKLVGVHDASTIRDDLILQLNSINEYESNINKLSSILSKLEISLKSIVTLRKIEKIDTPSFYNPARMEEYELLESHLGKLNGIIFKIIPIKKIGSIIIPDEISEMEVYLKLNNYAWTCTEKDILERLEESYNIGIPELNEDEFKSVSVMETHLSRIEKYSKGISFKFELPETIDEISIYENLSLIQDKVKSIESDIEVQSKELNILGEEFNKLQVQINAIPKCPTCEQPHAGQH